MIRASRILLHFNNETDKKNKKKSNKNSKEQNTVRDLTDELFDIAL